jgi:hypothetical protein
MKRRIVVVLLGIVFVASAALCAVAFCTASGAPDPSQGVDAVTTATKRTSGKSKTEDIAQPQEESNIAEAVFRYEFDHNASAVQKDASAYFLAFGAANAPKDPGADFLKRFADVKPTVKPASASLKSGETRSVIDKSTTKPGVIFYVERLKWTKKDEADVQGGYYESSKSSSSEVYSVVQKGGKWTVTTSKKGEIS